MLYSDNINTHKKFKSAYSLERYEKKKKNKNKNEDFFPKDQEIALTTSTNEKLDRSIYQTMGNRYKLYNKNYEEYDPIDDDDIDCEIENEFINPTSRKKNF
ncbi:hypothetical protein M0813_19108 [Anaeramoeba flamelloides]|uniref:Uncharacterized protein n=1 Tax=Anaeramoeba flamelloides TaxID=1746091 RepID=A0ABQ8YP99_9EUKA|nr:hypothetical protein M0813_19108 [Anaeramoeba flamelloides]